MDAGTCRAIEAVNCIIDVGKIGNISMLSYPLCVSGRAASLNGVERACEWVPDRACLDGEIWLAESIQDQRLLLDLTLRICRDPLRVYKKYTGNMQP